MYPLGYATEEERRQLRTQAETALQVAGITANITVEFARTEAAATLATAEHKYASTRDRYAKLADW